VQQPAGQTTSPELAQATCASWTDFLERYQGVSTSRGDQHMRDMVSSVRPHSTARPVRELLKVVAVMVVAGLVLGGCRGQQDGPGEDGEGSVEHRIDWDLSEGHELDRIDWGEVVGDEHDLQILTGGVDLRLVLPGGHVVEERMKRVQVYRDETHLVTVDGVLDRDLSLDETMELAEEWAERFDIGLHNFERWHDRMVRREQQGRSISTTANGNGPPLGPTGPYPSIRTIRSGSRDGEQPVSLVVHFSWDPQWMVEAPDSDDDE
jgi:hypothetical protein